MQLQILLLMLPLAFARLSVRANVSMDTNDVNVDQLGEDVIDDGETHMYRLTEEPLKEAVERYMGPRPTDAFLNSSTPWGALYQRYGWPQVHRVLKPINNTILGKHSQPVIIAKKKFRNISTKMAGYSADTYYMPITSSWNSGYSINFIMKPQILLLMLPLAFARLSIRLDVSTNMNDVKVELLGEDDHVIDEDETILFRLTEGSLKEACRRFHGARPTNVYLHSPSPWDDLYQTYGWFQVHRLLKPVKVTVLGIHREPETIATQQFTNHGTKSAQNNGQISQSLINTVTNSWNSGDIINIGEDVNYELTLPIGKVGAKTTFSYSHQWGKSGSHAEAVTVTATAGVPVPVAPGETVVSTLTASRATVEVEVTYEASLYGDVATHFEYTHKGRHFWEYGVNAVMEAGDLPRTIRRSEIIKVGFYTEMDIVLNEKDGVNRSLKSTVVVN